MQKIIEEEEKKNAPRIEKEKIVWRDRIKGLAINNFFNIVNILKPNYNKRKNSNDSATPSISPELLEKKRYFNLHKPERRNSLPEIDEPQLKIRKSLRISCVNKRINTMFQFDLSKRKSSTNIDERRLSENDRNLNG